MKSKKGDGLKHTLLDWILLSLAVIVVGGFVYNLVDAWNNQEPDLLCKASIAQAAATGGFLTIDCPIVDVKIIEKDLESGNGYRLIAERMRACWNYFSEGELEPFKSEILGLGAVVCKTCADIEFDDVSDLEVDGFVDYLEDTDMLRSSTKYIHYLYDKLGIDYSTLVPDKLDTTKHYYVMYQVYNKDLISVPFFSNANRVPSTVRLVAGTDLSTTRCDYEFD